MEGIPGHGYGMNAEARGKMRVLKKRLTAQYDKLDAILTGPAMRDPASAFAFRHSEKGRTRALKTLCKILGPVARFQTAYMKGRRPLALWMILRPQPSIFVDEAEPQYQQDTIISEFIAVGKITEEEDDYACCRVMSGIWTLDVPDHALGRLLMRARHADPEQVLLNAHRAVLQTKVEDILHEITQGGHAVNGGRQSFLLPAGPGVFVCSPYKSPTDDSLYLRMPTWLAEDQLYEHQLPIATVAAANSDESIGYYMLPSNLRV